MSVPTPFFGFSLLLSILVFAGCQIRPSCASNDALQPGETIWVCNAKHVVKTEDTEARILADGTVTLPFIGAVRLAGLTISEAERTVQDAFRVASFYTQPQVRILREHAKLRGLTPKKDDLVEYEIEDDCDCPKGWSEDKFLTIPENLQKIISGGEEVNTGVKVNYPTWWPNHDGQSVE